MEAYCVKCRTKRELKEPTPVFTASGGAATTGLCPVCGTKLFRMGKTPAHEGMVAPPVKKKQKKKNNRNGKLVVVESPAKAKTVGRYLGKGFVVRASVGHVRDLLKSQLSVDIENEFTPKYRVPNDKRSVVKEIKNLADRSKEIYLATDPDREGEAIAWHLMEAAEMDSKITRRVVFNEITKGAVTDAFANPRDIDMSLVNAQQARRVLDRLVGYSLSPILWRKVRGRLSAGRVQSVALRLIVDREREIDEFTSVEYWNILAEVASKESKDPADHFIVKLTKIDGEDLSLGSKQAVEPVLIDMETAKYHVKKIKLGVRNRKPAAPFITSTLQQDASRKLGFTAKRTMQIAQQLYEGIDIGDDGNTGLITYMRTDSTNVSQVAQAEARSYILKKYGESYVPETPPKYKTKARGAQEAHEAIRPTSVFIKPKDIKSALSRDQYRLYQLIWQRFIASQMAKAVYDTVTVEVRGNSQSHKYSLRASGSTLRFQGFLVVYEEAKDEDDGGENGNGANIPTNLKEKELLDLYRLIPEQHFTQPPPRFTEASLVKTLEENGIGRPSTYAPTLATLQQRGYVLRESKRLIPTDTGNIVNDLLAQYFPNILDVGFTARMEEALDKIATGDQSWVELVSEFYNPFAEQVEIAKAEMPEVKVEPESYGQPCPKCGRDLVIRWGRFGKFISCSGFPDCRHTEPWLEKIGVSCPQDGGDLVERKTRKGRTFYGCVNYPECDFTSWKRPVATACPQCSGLMIILNSKQVQCTQCEETFPLEKIGTEVV